MWEEQVANAFLRPSGEFILWMRCSMRVYELEMTMMGTRSMRTRHRYMSILYREMLEQESFSRAGASQKKLRIFLD
jgi:hypothetical protein